VNVQTRFDEHTISSHCGNSPLTPSPRAVILVDNRGCEYAISEKGQTTPGNSWTPLTQPLCPGESYVTPLVFDLPSDAQGLKLFIRSPVEPRWLGRIFLGDAASILHKKVYLGLPS
jgi:hypothetical protein